MDYSSYNESENSFSFLSFTPALTLSYLTSKNSQIRLNASQNPVIPSLSQLNNAQVPIDNFIIYTGNNNLKPYLTKSLNLSYSLQMKKTRINPELTYKYANEPFEIFYKYDDLNKIYIKTYDNIAFSDEVNASLSITYKPFSFLDFHLYSEIYQQRNEIEKQTYSLIDYYLTSSINVYYKNLILNLAYKSDYDMLYGDFIYTESPFSSVSLYYKKGNFILGLDVYYPLSEAWYSSGHTVSRSLVNEKENVFIYDNGRMFLLHIRYNFAAGHKGFETSKQIDNDDNDTGILKVD